MEEKDDDYKDSKRRVTTFLKEDEKEDLEKLAWRNGRSVSGFIRYMIVKTIESNKR
ncbi:MAG: hypothetical protein STSR0002_18540 [Smithella sp.]|jgi:hypothetical protein